MKLSFPGKENHQALWNWLADHPLKEKVDWPGFVKMEQLGFDPLDFGWCFACRDTRDCDDCPITWTQEGNHECFDKDSPFWGWDNSTDPKERSNYARIIANLWR